MTDRAARRPTQMVGSGRLRLPSTLIPVSKFLKFARIFWPAGRSFAYGIVIPAATRRKPACLDGQTRDDRFLQRPLGAIADGDAMAPPAFGGRLRIVIDALKLNSISSCSAPAISPSPQSVSLEVQAHLGHCPLALVQSGDTRVRARAGVAGRSRAPVRRAYAARPPTASTDPAGSSFDQSPPAAAGGAPFAD